MNRRDFLKASGVGALSLAASPLATKAQSDVPAFAKNAQRLDPVIKNAVLRSNPKLTGKKASFFIDVHQSKPRIGRKRWNRLGGRGG